TKIAKSNNTVTQAKQASSTQADTSLFEVGLTNSEKYQRTQAVSMIAQGYQNAANITITIRSATGNAPGFPTTGLADSLGVLAYAWTSIPPSVPIGNYTVTLTG